MQHLMTRPIIGGLKNNLRRPISTIDHFARPIPCDYIERSFIPKLSKFIKSRKNIMVLCDRERGTNPFVERIMTCSQLSDYHIIRWNCKGMEEVSGTYYDIYAGINSRITTNGVVLPPAIDSYEFERVLLEEECGYVLKGKKAVLVLESYSRLLYHQDRNVLEHFHKQLEKMLGFSKAGENLIQSIVCVDTFLHESLRINFQETMEEYEIELPDYFRNSSWNCK